MIAQQTRSKVSLTAIPLSTIEKTYQAPDAPLDLYESNQHANPHYYNFLSKLNASITATGVENDEDASDPDYRPPNAQDQPSKCEISTKSMCDT